MPDSTYFDDITSILNHVKLHALYRKAYIWKVSEKYCAYNLQSYRLNMKMPNGIIVH